MAERRRNEKEEEKREKEDEKRSEKQSDEKFRRNPARAVMYAAILIWGGIVALLTAANLVTAPWWQGWSVFLAGTGAILLLKAAYNLRPEHRRPVGGKVIIGLILLGVGVGSIVGWIFTGPAILIIIGIIMVFWVVLRRR
jgi:hypothetical protein